MNSNKNKLNSEIIYNFYCFPNTQSIAFSCICNSVYNNNPKCSTMIYFCKDKCKVSKEGGPCHVAGDN